MQLCPASRQHDGVLGDGRHDAPLQHCCARAQGLVSGVHMGAGSRQVPSTQSRPPLHWAPVQQGCESSPHAVTLPVSTGPCPASSGGVTVPASSGGVTTPASSGGVTTPESSGGVTVPASSVLALSSTAASRPPPPPPPELPRAEQAAKLNATTSAMRRWPKAKGLGCCMVALPTGLTQPPPRATLRATFFDKGGYGALASPLGLSPKGGCMGSIEG